MEWWSWSDIKWSRVYLPAKLSLDLVSYGKRYGGFQDSASALLSYTAQLDTGIIYVNSPNFVWILMVQTGFVVLVLNLCSWIPESYKHLLLACLQWVFFFFHRKWGMHGRHTPSRYETLGCSSGLDRLCYVWLWHIGPPKFMKPLGLELVASVHAWEHVMIRSAKLWT